VVQVIDRARELVDLTRQVLDARSSPRGAVGKTTGCG
jgi:hypothetical protein